MSTKPEEAQDKKIGALFKRLEKLETAIYGKRPQRQMKCKIFIFTPELKQRMAELGLDPIPSCPDEIPEAIQARLRAEGFSW